MPSPDSKQLYPDKRPFTASEENKPAGDDDGRYHAGFTQAGYACCTHDHAACSVLTQR